MPDKFDPYREKLVVEDETIWPEEFEHLDEATRSSIAQLLHADPENCEHLEYLRMHTGFCRRVVVTPGDVERVSG